MAGFFDGEGCVMFSGGTIRVVITNTYRPMLKWLEGAFGGTVLEMATGSGLGYRRLFRWQISGKNAATFLSDIVQYLGEKREQAEIALALPSIPPCERVPLLVRLAALKRINHGDPSDRR